MSTQDILNERNKDFLPYSYNKNKKVEALVLIFQTFNKNNSQNIQLAQMVHRKWMFDNRK